MGIQGNAVAPIAITWITPTLSDSGARGVSGAYPHRTNDHSQLTGERALRRIITRYISPPVDIS